jgi:NAD(P)-dependent dehydrogenase (short-subunit alcohol dehydrogenase family)
VRAIEVDGSQALAIPADVSDESRVKAMLELYQRLSEPMDMGRVAVRLASDDSAYVTGPSV